MKTSAYALILLLTLFAHSCFKLEAQTPEAIKVRGIAYEPSYHYKGSPYLFNHWTRGTLKHCNGSSSDTLQLKFNLLNNEVIFYHHQHQRMYQVDRNAISGFTLYPDTKTTRNFIIYKGWSSGFNLSPGNYVEVIYHGKMILLGSYGAIIQKAGHVADLNELRQDYYYFLLIDHQPTEIKLKLRSLYRLFPHMKNEIRRAASNMRFQKKNPEKMAQMLQWIDEQSSTP